ncbi:CocE/NonD family hydrolase [candidate division KSB1 bacterium]
MRKRFQVALRFVCLLVFIIITTAFADYGVVHESMVPGRMRDGVTLYSEIYRPDAEGKYPVLLSRTPYGNYWVGHEPDEDGFVARAVGQGYVMILQDVRGRYRSEGDFYPFINEGADGYDSVQWAAELPWSNGRVGMFGGSYVGIDQLLAAVESPPALVAIAPAVAVDNLRNGLIYHSGALVRGITTSWAFITVATESLRRRQGLLIDPEWQRVERERRTDLIGSEKWFRRTDWTDIPPVREGLVNFYGDWMEKELDSPYWDITAIDKNYKKILVPALLMGGWYDIFKQGTLNIFQGLRSTGGSAKTRSGTRLLMGPWVHSGPSPGNTSSGEMDFGEQAGRDGVAIQLEFFDRWMKNIDNGLDRKPPVDVFVMGENDWTRSDNWPPDGAREECLYLDSDGPANSIYGAGKFLFGKAPKAMTQQFIYDPANPVPTTGGDLCCSGVLLPAGVFDQRPVEVRTDVLVYTSDPLKKPLRAVGPVKTILYASSSAVDTDFTAKLVDVYPDGFAANVTEGIIRARFRAGSSKSEPITPGKVYRYEIDMNSTAIAFLPGHRVRLEISSSNFPHFDRNPNTGQPLARRVGERIAEQAVHQGGRQGSHLVLTVLD